MKIRSTLLLMALLCCMGWVDAQLSVRKVNLPGTSFDFRPQLEKLPNGDFGMMTRSNVPGGTTECMLARLDEDGIVIWEEAIAVAGHSFTPQGLDVDGSGNFVITGNISENGNKVDGIRVNINSSNGSLVSYQTISNFNMNDDLNAYGEYANGNTVVVGTTQFPSSSGIPDFYWMELTPGGSVASVNRFGGPFGEELSGGFVTSNQDLIMFGGTNTISTGNSVAYIVTRDGMGNTVGSAVNGYSEVYVGDIIEAPNGNLLAVFNVDPGNNIHEIVLAEMTPVGTLLWQKRFSGGTDFISASHLEISPSGNITVGGNRNLKAMVATFDINGNFISSVVYDDPTNAFEDYGDFDFTTQNRLMAIGAEQFPPIVINQVTYVLSEYGAPACNGSVEELTELTGNLNTFPWGSISNMSIPGLQLNFIFNSAISQTLVCESAPCLPIDEAEEFTLIDLTNNTISSDQAWEGKYYITAPVAVNAHLDVTNADVIFAQDMGMTINFGGRLEATNSVFRTCDTKATWAGLLYSGTGGGIVKNCTFLNGLTAIEVSGTQDGVEIQNNLFSNCNTGVSINGSGVPEYVYGISGNTFELDLWAPTFRDPGGNVLTDFFGIQILNTYMNGSVSQNQFVSTAEATVNRKFYGLFTQRSSLEATQNRFSNVFCAFQANDPSGLFNTLFEQNEISYSYDYKDASDPVRVFGNGGGVIVVIENNTIDHSLAGDYGSNGIYLNGVNNVIVHSNDIKGFHTGIRAEESTGLYIAQNEIRECENFGIVTIDCYANTRIYQNVIHMEGIVGIEYILNGPSGSYKPSTIDIEDNCIFDTEIALATFQPTNNILTIPEGIRGNYLFNYTGYGYFNRGFEGNIGSCPVNDLGRNTFFSNYLAPFGTARDAISNAGFIQMEGNSPNIDFVFNGNINVVTNCDAYSRSACGNYAQKVGESRQERMQNFYTHLYPVEFSGEEMHLTTNWETWTASATPQELLGLLSALKVKNSAGANAFFEWCQTHGNLEADPLIALNRIGWADDPAALGDWLANEFPAEAGVDAQMLFVGLTILQEQPELLREGVLPDYAKTLIDIREGKGTFASLAASSLAFLGHPFEWEIDALQTPEGVGGDRHDWHAVDQDLFLFPNPNAGSFEFAFDLKGSEAVQWEVLDLMGKVWATGDLNVAKGQGRVESMGTPTGFYLLRLTAADGTHLTRKFMVE